MKTLVTEAARKLNFFPNRHGISPHYSPRQIVHRQPLNYKLHCQYSLGSYVQAHDEPDPTNTQEPRSLDAVYLRPMDHGHEVYNLATQRVITRRHLTVFPVTPTIIQAVEQIAAHEEQKGLRIKTKQGHTIYDSSWTAGVDYDEEEQDDNYEEDDDEEEEDEDDSEQDEDNNEEPYNEHEAYEIVNDDFIQDDKTAGVQQEHSEDELSNAEENDSAGVQEEGSVQEDDEDTAASPTDQQSTRRSERTRTQTTFMSPTTSGQSHGTRVYNHLIVDEQEATEYDLDLARYATQFLMMAKLGQVSRNKTRHPSKQGCFLITYSLQKGIKKFKRQGFDAAKDEMKQLHDRSCWNPIMISTLTKTEIQSS